MTSEVSRLSSSKLAALEKQLSKPLTTKEVAKFLDIHPRTVTRMAERGELPAFRIGTLWRFRPVDIEVWMADQVSLRQLNPVRGN